MTFMLMTPPYRACLVCQRLQHVNEGPACREAEERAEAERLALEKAAQEKVAMEKAIAEREERAKAAAAAPRRASAAAAASPADSDDSGPPLYMPVQHRPGDHGSVPSVRTTLASRQQATTIPAFADGHSSTIPQHDSALLKDHPFCRQVVSQQGCLRSL